MSEASGRATGWAIHLFTASSAVLAFLALGAVEGSRWREALLWLLAALVVDGVDGTLARRAEVTKSLPQIDGSALDLVVDYLTYVFVPACFLWRLGAFPSALALPLVALILLSSLYTFARRDMKTDDSYFRGFPALWNIVALYVYVASPAPWINPSANRRRFIAPEAAVRQRPLRRNGGCGQPAGSVSRARRPPRSSLSSRLIEPP